ALVHDFTDEPISVRQSSTDAVGGADDQIERKGTFESQGDADCLVGLSGGRHDHEKVHVAEFVGLAISVGPEKHDPVWVKSLRDLPGEATYGRHRDVRRPILCRHFFIGKRARSFSRHCLIVPWPGPRIKSGKYGDLTGVTNQLSRRPTHHPFTPGKTLTLPQPDTVSPGAEFRFVFGRRLWSAWRRRL